MHCLIMYFQLCIPKIVHRVRRCVQDVAEEKLEEAKEEARHEAELEHAEEAAEMDAVCGVVAVKLRN